MFFLAQKYHKYLAPANNYAQKSLISQKYMS